MGQDFQHKNARVIVMNSRDQTVFIVVNIENRHRASALDFHKINRGAKGLFHVCRTSPLCRISYVVPLCQRLLGILLVGPLPEALQFGMTNDPHATAYIMYTRRPNVQLPGKPVAEILQDD